MRLARTMSGICSEKNSSVSPPLSSRQLASAHASAGSLVAINSWRNSMANISPCPFVVVPAVVKSENEEAAGIPRRPLSPALERWEVYPVDQSFGLSGHTSALVAVMAKCRCACFAATADADGMSERRSRDATERPASGKRAVPVVRHNGAPFRADGPAARRP